LSENESLLTLPPWCNPYLLVAIALSMALHFMILYVPFFTHLFAITSLTWPEWQGVILISLPVLFLDEFMKLISRIYFTQSPAAAETTETRDAEKEEPEVEEPVVEEKKTRGRGSVNRRTVRGKAKRA
jgi:Ca2+ transporting ATPase